MSIVVVDPFSTGALVALESHKRGFPVIALWTDEVGDNRGHHPEEVDEVADSLFTAEVVQDAATGLHSLDELAVALRAAAGEQGVMAIICGAESGVKVTDALSEHMGLRGNGTSLPNRRDKRVQCDAVRRAGLRAVREACGTAWAEVAPFVATEPMPVVVKPVESAGSDGVKLCHSAAEAQAHFELLMRSQRRLGPAIGAAVLVQEFLAGEEYVIDHVTRDGVHKTAMVWRYEKRPANGAQFVYYNMEPVAADAPHAAALVAYTRSCLDAIAITNGATHSEVMLTKGGPCLVEVNCRCGGFNGSWLPLATALAGYSQVSMVVDAFVAPASFDALPALPPTPFRAAGCNPFLVSTQAGVVRATPGYAALAALPSCVRVDRAVRVGERVAPTVDLFTQPGQCVLVHDDAAVVAADLAALRLLEAEGKLFAVDADAPSPPPAAVALERPCAPAAESDAPAADDDDGAARPDSAKLGPVAFERVPSVDALTLDAAGAA